MSWRVAKSLETLRAQINQLAPNRKKASDGTIGDTAHAKTKSDHNPNAKGVVTALDITHDPENGCDCNEIAKSLVASRDPRIKYIIWNEKINNRTVSPWVWRDYSGPNPHTKHIHISVAAEEALYDDARPWAVQVAAAPPPRPAEPPPVKPVPPSPAPIPAPAPVTPGGAILAPTAGVLVTTGAFAVAPLVGWIVGAVVVAGLVVYYLRKRKGLRFPWEKD